MQELCNVQVTFEWHFFKKDEVLIRSKQNLSNPGKCIKLNIFSDVIKQQTPFHRINLKKIKRIANFDFS